MNGKPEKEGSVKINLTIPFAFMEVHCLAGQTTKTIPQNMKITARKARINNSAPLKNNEFPFSFIEHIAEVFIVA
jgi:hypothetical protein